MKVVALLSGGKDSCCNLMHCVANGHDIVALATLIPEVGIDELDSYMYQSVGTTVFLPLIAQALRLPLYRQTIRGKPLNVSSTYGSRVGPAFGANGGSHSDQKGPTKETDETEDLTALLRTVLKHHPDVDALSSGAILSTYQRLRIEHVASRLNLTCLSYLWQRPERKLVDEMIAAGMGEGVVLVKVAGLGLEVGDVGKTLGAMRRKLGILEDKYGCHVAGEGGEFETITLDCPLFHERIEILEKETIITDPSPVAYLRVTSAHLVDKTVRGLDGSEVSYVPPNVSELCAMLRIGEEGIEGISRFDEGSEEILEDLERWKPARHTSRLVPSTVAAPSDLAAVKGNSIGEESLDFMGEDASPRPPSFGRQGDWFCVSIDGWTDAGQGVEQEVTKCFERLQAELQLHGLSLLHIQHQNFLLNDMSDFPLANKAYSAFFGTSPPSRACVSLPLPPHQRVRLEAYGFDDSDVGPNQPERRSALHVQSMSYWAPANIGPYSQAVMVNNRLSIAGQIGLLPSTLLFPEPRSFRQEAILALQHVRRIVHVLRSKESAGGNWQGWVEGVIAWYTCDTDLAEAREIWRLHCRADEIDERIPILFVQAKALPKGALVEWQVAMHTGRLPSSSESIKEDPDATANVAYSHHARYARELVSCRSADAASSFTIWTGQDDIDAALGRSFSLRVFHRVGHQPEQAQLAPSVTTVTSAASYLPCMRLSTLTQADLDFAFVGLGI